MDLDSSNVGLISLMYDMIIILLICRGRRIALYGKIYSAI